MSIEELPGALLLFVLPPLWLGAGLADYLCHRHQRIEHSTGRPETTLHLLMLAELGIAVAAAALLAVNACVLLLALLCCLAHELTTWVDLSYATARRSVPAIEQWVHALQLALPWSGLLGLALLHHEQALAALGAGTAAADWALRWKEPPLPPAYLATLLMGAVTLALVPLLDEWRRDSHAAKERS